jgi:protein-tyrosine phosphatase
MAEAVLKEKLKRKGRRDIAVSSAALIDMKGKPADPLAVKILKENRIEGDAHISTLLTDEMVVNADLIVVMDESQKKQLSERYPEAEEKIRLLKSFIKGYQGFDSDIKDPYQLTIYHYRLCFAEISTAVGAMLGVL